jgi:hypothetical protein
VQELISSGNVMGYSMSLELHLLHSHLDFFFPENKGTVSVEHGEKLHQATSQIEERVENVVQMRWLTAAGVL